MSNDSERLRHFAQTHDEATFTAIVQQHLGFVHAVALRRLRDPHLAQDATQAVFIALARKAAVVARSPSVIGWLHRSTCYETRNLMRAQAHRLARETEAQRIGTAGPADAPPPLDLAALEPVLDDALGELAAADREAIFARYFSEQSYAQIGTTLRLTENAARMRVERALLKLRARLQRRGLDSTAAALALALPACASAAVPAGTAAAVAKASFAGFSAGGGAAGLFAFMSTTKIAATAGALAVLAGFIYQHRETAALASSLTTLRHERAGSAREVADLRQQVSALQQRLAKQPPAPASGATPATKAAASDTASAERPETPGITRKPPPGWHKNGTKPDLYDVGVDTLTTWGGMPSAYAASIGQAGGNFGGMMQTISTGSYKNQRVKLTGWMKTQDANDGGGHLWLRIDGENRQLQFDNMDGRAPKGTTDWQEYSLVLDVPAEATLLNYGFFIAGSGKMWVNGLTITPVGPETPTTNMTNKPPPVPSAPVNLGFAPPTTKS